MFEFAGLKASMSKAVLKSAQNRKHKDYGALFKVLIESVLPEVFAH
jgi:hypothetical protein